MKMNRSQCRLEIKSAEPQAEDGLMSFSGYGAVFGNVDAYGDIIEKGAFRKTIEEFKASGRWPAMLSQHGGWGLTARDMTPVGVWTEMKEDDHGLYVEGVLADTERGRELYTLMKMQPRPAIDGMSIGFYCTDYTDEKVVGDTIRHITGIDLVELSLVTFPANGEARVGEVKSEDLSIRDAEHALRDAGFSRAEAKRILAEGFSSSTSLRDAEAKDDTSELAELLRRNISAMKGGKE